MLDVFNAVIQVVPCTICTEAVKLRLGIAQTIEKKVCDLDLDMDMTVFDGGGKPWAQFVIQPIRNTQREAKAPGEFVRLHLWPDHESHGAKKVVAGQPDSVADLVWLQTYWNRVNDWPGKKKAGSARGSKRPMCRISSGK